jgi:L-ascorbate metabolism protein UlaG (beta-lactamase superfamily)
MKWIHAACILAAATAIAACAQGRLPTVASPPPPSLGEATTERPTIGAAELRLHYLGNEGFLVEGARGRVLVDALFGDGIAGYTVVPADLREQLEQGTGAWGDVAIAMASHDHPDHFDPAAVGRFLRGNPRAVFVSTPQAIEALGRTLESEPELLSRARAVLPAPGASERLEIHGVDIIVLNLHHGVRNPPVENIGLIVALGDLKFLHFGDTEAKMEDFEPYLEELEGTDLALLPFWFLASEWRAAMVRDVIRPQWIVAGHTPTQTAPASHFARWRSYQGLVEVMHTAFPQAHIPRRPAEVYNFGNADE